MTAISDQGLARDARSSVIWRVVAYAMSLFAAITVSRTLGAEGKGLLGLATAVPGMIAAIGALGMSTAVTIAAREGWLPRRLTMAVLAAYAGSMGVASVVVGLVWGFELNQSGVATAYATAAMASVGGLLLADNAAGLLQGAGAVRRGMWVRQSVGIGQSAIVVCIVALGIRDPLPIIVLMAGWSWLCGAAGYALAAGVSWPLYAPGQVSWFRRLLGIGIRTQALWILLLLNYRLDMTLLGALASLSEVGVYSVAVGFSEVAWFGVNGLVGVLLPHLAGMDAESASLRAARALRLAVLATLILAVCVSGALILLAVPVFGAEFQKAPLAFILLSPGLVTLAAFKVLAVYAVATRTLLMPTLLTGVGLALNVGLNLLLIPDLGSAGAAIASSTSYTFMAGGLVLWFGARTGLTARDVFVPVRADLIALRGLWRR